MIFDSVLVPRGVLPQALAALEAARDQLGAEFSQQHHAVVDQLLDLAEASPSQHWCGAAVQLRSEAEALRTPMPADHSAEQRVPWAQYRRFERHRELAGALWAALKADTALARIQAEAKRGQP